MKKTILSANQTLRNISLAFIVLASVSCTKENTNPFLLRVENKSSVALENLVFFALEGEYSYGDVTPGNTSRYQVIQSAYRTPACTFKVKGSSYNAVVRCATPSPETISSGNFSLVIHSVGGTDADIELVRE
ncbi:hypothetical protein [Pollutibacter soli]|uniref:hypothetical protein n=1 Tax=Pollutibacter soli TaxID=3034157 RepID=UPI0030133A1B